MALQDGSRFFNTPSYTFAQWAAKNPVLLKGERGYETHPITGIPWRAKIGDGILAWNALPYELELYPYSTPPTNIIGDATGNLQYTPVSDILQKMLNPYFKPTFFAPVISVNDSPYAQEVISEIGVQINAPVNFLCGKDSAINLAATPYIVSASGFFTNEGAFAALPAGLTLSGGFYTPAAILNVTLKLKGLLTNASFTNEVEAYLRAYPKIIWGCSNLTTLIPSDWASLSSRHTSITNDFEKDFDFDVPGYGWLAIPAMLSPVSLTFTDVTIPTSPLPYGWQAMGAQTINNGVTSYSYQTYRTIYSQLSASVARVRE